VRRLVAELRGPVSALVLLGILARLLLPLPALAGAGVVALEAAARATLCAPSGEAALDPDDAPAAVPGGAHCPLCRLPDADPWQPATPPALPSPAWDFRPAPVAAPAASLTPGAPRGPPPARAPPRSPNAV
jgi:hypothetical protein